MFPDERPIVPQRFGLPVGIDLRVDPNVSIRKGILIFADALVLKL